MEIISGKARGIIIRAPRGLDVRPTAVRARRALMDSLFELSGLRVVDLCAGSGGVGLEAASRGASEVLLVEKDAAHCHMIEENIAAVKKAGAEFDSQVVRADILDCIRYSRLLAEPDLIFADPPYAESAQLFRDLLGQAEFQTWAAHARIIWELPDTPGSIGEFLSVKLPAHTANLRRFGAANFLIFGPVGRK